MSGRNPTMLRAFIGPMTQLTTLIESMLRETPRRMTTLDRRTQTKFLTALTRTGIAPMTIWFLKRGLSKHVSLALSKPSSGYFRIIPRPREGVTIIVFMPSSLLAFTLGLPAKMSYSTAWSTMSKMYRPAEKKDRVSSRSCNINPQTKNLILSTWSKILWNLVSYYAYYMEPCSNL